MLFSTLFWIPPLTLIFCDFTVIYWMLVTFCSVISNETVNKVSLFWYFFKRQWIMVVNLCLSALLFFWPSSSSLSTFTANFLFQFDSDFLVSYRNLLDACNFLLFNFQCDSEQEGFCTLIFLKHLWIMVVNLYLSAFFSLTFFYIVLSFSSKFSFWVWVKKFPFCFFMLTVFCVIFMVEGLHLMCPQLVLVFFVWVVWSASTKLLELLEMEEHHEAQDLPPLPGMLGWFWFWDYTQVWNMKCVH